MLPAALCALTLLPLGASAAETCTTAVGPIREYAFDAPLDASCAAAVLIVSPNPAAPGAIVTLDGSPSVGGDVGSEQISRYEWTFGDGAFDQTDAPDASVTHAYARGAYTVGLQIVSAGGPLDSTTVDLIVSDPPVAALDVPGGVLRPGVDYAFDASASSAPGGSIARYDWDWGDGTRTLDGGPTPVHRFVRESATTQVTVTVVNDLGLSDSESVTVPVSNQLPLVQLIATPATVQVGEQLRLDATGSSDPDGAIAEYRWDLDTNGSFETSTGTTPSVTAGGYPNPGPIVLRVKVVDDSAGASVKGVTVTIARPVATDDGDSGGGATGGSGSGGSGTGSSGGSGSGGSTTGTAERFSVTLGGNAVQRLTGALRRGIGLQALANRAAGGRLIATVSARDAKLLRLPRKGSRPVAVGTVQLALTAGRTAKPSIKLTARAARALRHAHPSLLRVTIRGRIAAATASAAVVRVVLLRG